MRCLEPAEHGVAVDAREVDQPGGGEEAGSPYIDEGDELDLKAWARDALALAPADPDRLPRGLPRPLRDLRREPQPGGPGPRPRGEPDPRWAALRELELD